MSAKLNIAPAYATGPGVRVERDGVVFSVIFRGISECGLELFHLPDFEKTTIAFDDRFRFGSLYSVKIFDLDPDKWCYRYYSGPHFFEDPYARELIRIPDGGDEITACRLYPGPEDRLPGYVRRDAPVWGRQFIYLLHVKGFTWQDPQCPQPRGTFCALTYKLPYLKSLGVTAVELMPVYELRPDRKKGQEPATMEEALQRYPVNMLGEPVIKSEETRGNFWGFGNGFYFAPKRSYSDGEPQKEFHAAIERFHQEGISVYLQLYFGPTASLRTQLDTARFYVTHYGIDGFHLTGSAASVRAFASDPILADTVLMYHDFPYEEIQQEDAENPQSGIVSVANLAEYRYDFQNTVRRFVKSDDYVMNDFLGQFTSVPERHGRINFVSTYEGFTLRDLVSYNEKHNEMNGEDGRDGNPQNFSWNCGVEGEARSAAVRALRRKQIRNFLTILFLAQGTPLLYQGDERYNTQKGDNNAWNQDNKIGWIDWTDTPQIELLTKFVRRLSQFRREHPVFSMDRPFRHQDYRGFGFPDISYHGREAWKPDLSNFSHAVGILYCENYIEDSPEQELLYLAINMHWEKVELGLPKLRRGRRWNIVMDTSREDSFLEGRRISPMQHSMTVPARTILILNAVSVAIPKDYEENVSEKTQDLEQQLQKAADRRDGPHILKTLSPGQKEELLGVFPGKRAVSVSVTKEEVAMAAKRDRERKIRSLQAQIQALSAQSEPEIDGDGIADTDTEESGDRTDGSL